MLILFDCKQSYEVGFPFPVLFSGEQVGLPICPRQRQASGGGVWVGLQISLLFPHATGPLNPKYFLLGFNSRVSMVCICDTD